MEIAEHIFLTGHLPLFVLSAFNTCIFLLVITAMVLLAYGFYRSKLAGYNNRIEAMGQQIEAMKQHLDYASREETKAREDAKRSAAARDKLLTSLSHEIRTPMNGILGMTILLEETNLNPEQRDYLDTIISSGRILLNKVDEVMANDKIQLNEELVQMFSWRNGSPAGGNPNVDLTLFCGCIFTPFEHSWLAYKYFRTESPFVGKVEHIPIMQDGGGVYLCYDNYSDSKKKGMIFQYDISNFPDVYVVKFESLTSLLKGTLECIRKKIYTVDSNGYIDIDFKRQREVFKVLNPNIDFWKSE